MKKLKREFDRIKADVTDVKEDVKEMREADVGPLSGGITRKKPLKRHEKNTDEKTTCSVRSMLQHQSRHKLFEYIVYLADWGGWGSFQFHEVREKQMRLLQPPAPDDSD